MLIQYYCRKIIILAAFICLSLTGAVAAGESNLPEATFTGERSIEQSLPYLTLKWEIAEDEAAEEPVYSHLQVATSPAFSDPSDQYRGPDRATFVSGLAEGEYYFRVRAVAEEGATGEWSEPVQVTVQYDSLAQAFLLFGIGAVVSIATVVLVVTGDRRARREAQTLR